MVVVLTIAGSDSIGGAGIQADLKAFAAMDVHGASVLTTVTAQNTVRVKSIWPLPSTAVIAQLEAVLEDARIEAAKTGMLHGPEIAAVVGRRLAQERFPVVVDPIMMAGVGDALGTAGVADAIKKELLPIATLVAPNKQEAESLAGFRINSPARAEEACRVIAAMGPKAVLLKGGHFGGERATDLLLSDDSMVEISAPRLAVRPHGAGCTLSAFITAYLARGLSLKEAVIAAKGRLVDALEASYAPGKGLVVLDQLATLRREEARYSVVTELRRAVDEIVPALTPRWTAREGLDFGFALLRPRGFHDLASVEGRVRPGKAGGGRRCFAYGGAGPTAQVLLGAARANRATRSAIGLSLSESNLDTLISSGLAALELKRAEGPGATARLETATEDAIRRSGVVPDVVYDRGRTDEPGPALWLLGNDPMNIVLKLRKALP
jgi:hydroxymethylpyrimidine kinase/phosphomethylpyrimidine kinase